MISCWSATSLVDMLSGNACLRSCMLCSVKINNDNDNHNNHVDNDNNNYDDDNDDNDYDDDDGYDNDNNAFQPIMS